LVEVDHGEGQADGCQVEVGDQHEVGAEADREPGEQQPTGQLDQGVAD